MADRITVKLIGGEQFMVDVRDWAGAIRDRVDIDARLAARSIARDAAMRYVRHDRTGTLANRVIVVKSANTPTEVQYRARSMAPHANLFEFGTRGVRTTTRRRVFVRGVGFRWVKNTGRMPASHIWVATAVAGRSQFFDALPDSIAQPAPKIGPGRPDVVGRLI